ncbi:hypothetical protein QYE76_025186 [Lolium multiflorum]|uniref:KIB1-4 beta-propeller domain-containing protein n=1 Tax=Lolium multiflorum TaxID=4521 RepID=A0AAD8VUE9_LOLMU|nr:hypothetical protein QYE76_025186 [Lolium multiflorum]
MGRRLPNFAPARAAAGRKRKGATLATLAVCKRPAPAQAIGGWASLPTDIVGLITCRILDCDVVDYISFRAVCSDWRACTPTPSDPTLRDPRLRPRDWVALCDGDGVRPDDAGQIVFFHTRTARRLPVLLPELRGYRIVGFTDGLLILVHKRTTMVRVLHPFTRVVVDLPSLAPVYHELVRQKKLLDMNAAVCSSASSATSIAVVVWFLCTNVALAADPNSDWEVLHRGLYVRSTLPFQGRLYATSLCSNKILQLYPPPRQEAGSVVVGHVPYFADRVDCDFLLIESGGKMLLVIQHPDPGTNSFDWLRLLAFKLYEVDVNSHRCKLIPVNSLGDRALFLSGDRCLSVSASDLPTLSSNSIYFSLPQDPIVMHSLGTGLSELLAESCQIHDRKDRIRPSVRPFTIADHLITYCNPREWSKGLMFHEYQRIPASFKEHPRARQTNEDSTRVIPTM